jgi:hypothetical protein
VMTYFRGRRVIDRHRFNSLLGRAATDGRLLWLNSYAVRNRPHAMAEESMR